uniref:Uncharacterized protein n=1 Tax=Romanomermis culicivorax TaxID=13658 RepID=A0A915HK08_ROMCU
MKKTVFYKSCLTRKTAGTELQGRVRSSVTTPVTKSAGTTSASGQPCSTAAVCTRSQNLYVWQATKTGILRFLATIQT